MNNFDNTPYKNRMLNLKLSNLLAFTTVADVGSFSQAARQLFLTQPTVSRRIADLENSLGTPLFDRIGNKVIMTEAARQLLPKARGILLEIQNTTKLIQSLSEEIKGEIRLGVSGYIAESYLRPIMQDFTANHPAVEITIELFGSSINAYHLLENGELDIVLATLPSGKENQHKIIPLWKDELSFVTSKNHPLAHQLEPSLETITQYPALLPDQGTLTREIIDNCFEQRELSFHLAPQITNPANFSVLKMLVSLGLGWSILPKIILDDTFHTLPIQIEALHRHLGIIFHPKRSLSNACKKFVTVCTHHGAL